MRGGYPGEIDARSAESRRNTRSAAVGALLVAVVIAVFGGSWYVNYANQTHPAAWPMVQGDAMGRFATRATFPAEPTMLWSYPVDDPQPFPPAIGADGTVYLHTPAQVLAIGPDGRRKWAWKSEREYGWLALGRHGDVYVVGREELIALDGQGRVQWRFPLPDRGGIAPPLVGQGGVIYIATARKVLAVTSDGKLKWEYTRGRAVAWPVETPSGQLLIATPGRLSALGPNGEEVWSAQFGDLVGNRTVAVAENGTIYYRGRDRIRVLDDQGHPLAEYPTDQPGTFNLALGNGVIQHGRTRWSDSGEVLWETEEPAVDGFTYLDAGGNVLVLSSPPRGSAPRLSLWGPDGTLRWRLTDMAVLSLPAIGADGRICFAGQKDGQAPALICLGDT